MGPYANCREQLGWIARRIRTVIQVIASRKGSEGNEGRPKAHEISSTTLTERGGDGATWEEIGSGNREDPQPSHEITKKGGSRRWSIHPDQHRC